MTSNTYETPDLASVLRTLAAYAPPNSSQEAALAPKLSIQHTEELEEGEYEPPDISSQDTQQPIGRPYTTQAGQLWSQQGPIAQHRNGSHAPAKAERPPRIDPATITDWSTGLKCVMRTVAQSEDIMARIRKMIKSQHEHERTWWAGREAILRKHEARAEKKRKLDDMLRSIGAKVPTATPVTSPEEDAAELTQWDKQVHRAAREMVDAVTREFKTMGIPFFGTKPDLIRETSDKGEHIELQHSDDHKAAKGTIADNDLLDLQRRMLETLEDLSRD
ncbi:MAG: hypothetical protein M1812_003273 [Candelaria pacifica]|nr:MAG: hypothetical protein M1812_003273 [Candelaria pacifica]